jgi:hypothetical protein
MLWKIKDQGVAAGHIVLDAALLCAAFVWGAKEGMIQEKGILTSPDAT